MNSEIQIRDEVQHTIRGRGKVLALRPPNAVVDFETPGDEGECSEIVRAEELTLITPYTAEVVENEQELAAPADSGEPVVEPEAVATTPAAPKFMIGDFAFHLVCGEGHITSVGPDGVGVNFVDENEGQDTFAEGNLLTKSEFEKRFPQLPQAAGAAPAKTPGSLLSYALACVRRGWHVFPCIPKSKAPAGSVVPHGVLDASKDESIIRAWWTINPDFNPAIALGPSNLVVYDFDEIKPFETLPPTFTVRTGRIPKDGIEGIQKYYIGSCKTHGHPGGGGEVRSRGAYVLGPGAIHPSGNTYAIISNLPLVASPEQNEELVNIVGPAIGTEAQEKIAGYVESNFDLVGINYQRRSAYLDGFKWLIECPWKTDHSEGNDFNSSTAVIMLPTGKFLYCCQHKHCKGIREWEQLRAWMEEKVGHFLVFGDPKDELNLPPATVEEYRKEVQEAQALQVSNETPVVALLVDPFAVGAHLGHGGDDEAATIPAFDNSVINGIYKTVVDLVCKNTTLGPQFVYVIAKTLVGGLIAGRIKFAELSAEPRLFTALIGETGSGKGEAWRRTWTALNPPSFLEQLRIKVTDSADSGAGIKDLFFEAPAEQPLCIYIDEIASMGDKASQKRNPDILNTIFELKDGTRVSRVKATSKGGTKTKSDARLVVVMCGQNRSVFSEALVGRTQIGGYDRLTPEHGVPQETGDLPAIDEAEAVKLRMAFEELVYADRKDCNNTMSFDEETKIGLDEYWATLPIPVRRKARWKQGLMVDCYLSAFGERRMVVEQGDLDIAIKIFERQLIIRQVFFGMEAPDRVGYYIRRIKDLLENMVQLIKTGMPEEQVALSRVDFTTKTVSCLSWNWRGRSSVKITERTHAKRAKTLHRRGEGGHSTTALVG